MSHLSIGIGIGLQKDSPQDGGQAYLYLAFGYPVTTGSPAMDDGVYRYKINEKDGTLYDCELAISWGTTDKGQGKILTDPATGLVYVDRAQLHTIYVYDAGLTQVGSLNHVSQYTGMNRGWVLHDGKIYINENGSNFCRYNLDLTGRTVLNASSGFRNDVINGASNFDGNGPMLFRNNTTGLVYVDTSGNQTLICDNSYLRTSLQQGLPDGSGWLQTTITGLNGWEVMNYSATPTRQYACTSPIGLEMQTHCIYGDWVYGIYPSSGVNRMQVVKADWKTGLNAVAYNAATDLGVDTGSGYYIHLAAIKH